MKLRNLIETHSFNEKSEELKRELKVSVSSEDL